MKKKLTAMFLIVCTFSTLLQAPTLAVAGINAEWITATADWINNKSGAPGSWESELSEHFYAKVDFDEDSATSGAHTGEGSLNWVSVSAEKWDGTTASNANTGAGNLSDEMDEARDNPDVIPALDVANKTYYVYSPQQFLYVARTLRAAEVLDISHSTPGNYEGFTINIMNDFDLAGEDNEFWPTDIRLPAYTTIEGDYDGDGVRATVYNMQQLSANIRIVSCGFVAYCPSIKMFNMVFSNAYVLGGFQVGVAIGMLKPTSAAMAVENELENISIVDCVAISRNYGGQSENEGGTGGIMGRYQNAAANKGGTMVNCNNQGSVIVGISHQGALTSTLQSFEKANSCFATECTIISYGSHSGGLFSCVANVTEISDCFVSADVYGDNQTGVFTGISSQTSFYNCYSTGFVEGKENLGGFIGQTLNTESQFYDCYTTALVGMRSNSKNLGGFTGNTSSGNSFHSVYINCYAAGEVGAADIDVSAPTASVAGTSLAGGFAGGGSTGGNVPHGRIQFAYCYYDKQTTAMREWDYGCCPQTEYNVGTIGRIDDGDRAGLNIQTTDPGIRGVLSTDTNKNNSAVTDRGLMTTTPQDTYYGFGGFKDGTEIETFYAGRNVDYSGWDYSEENHYPELKVFKNASGSKWGEYVDLVKAHSLASTAGMMLDTWNEGFDPATGEFDEANQPGLFVYCTSRDLTSSFDLTADTNNKWDRIGEAESTGTTGAKSTINGRKYEVLSLKHENGQWLCDELVPGIEWLKTTYTVNGVKAARRVRVIPTGNIEAGASVEVVDGKYDHADDVTLFYSTGKRMNKDLTDITTGIFPDSSAVAGANAITAKQQEFMNGATEAAINAQFSGENDKFTNIDASYMGLSGENAEHSILYVYVNEIAGFESGTNKIIKGASVDLTDVDKQAQYNGYALFDNTNQRYLVTYIWQLDDGRVLQDSKIVRHAQYPFDAELNLYKNGSLYTDGGYLFVNEPYLLASFNSNSVEAGTTDKDDVAYKQEIAAAWKLKNTDDIMDSLKITLTVDDEHSYSKTITNPTDGDKIKIDYVIYKIVYGEDHQYYVIPQTFEREYTLNYNSTTKIWSVFFDKVDEATSDENVVFNDVETNIRVDAYVKSNPAVVNLVGNKVLTGDRTTFANDEFTFVLTEDAGNDTSGYTGFTGGASLTSDGTIKFDNITFIKEGTYIFKASETGTAPSGYTYDTNPVTITVTVSDSGGGQLVAVPAFSKQGGGTTLEFTNTYQSGSSGGGGTSGGSAGTPRVSVAKTSVHTITGAGGIDNTITYTLTATNNGDGYASGIRIKDYIPEYTTFESVGEGGTYTADTGGDYVSWFISSLAPGGRKVMTFTVRVNECIPSGISIANTALYDNGGSGSHTSDMTDDPSSTTSSVTDAPYGEDVSIAELTKVDSEDTSTTLAGARFELYKKTGPNTDEFKGVFITGSTGKISVSGLSVGSYYWVETGAPVGYTKDDSRHGFSISAAGDSAEVTVTNERTEIPEMLDGIDHYAYIVGYPDTDVRPADNITRAEVATIFFRLLTDEVRNAHITRENSFSDVAGDDWFNVAVSTMEGMDIVSGYPDGSFRPNENITRAEFAAIAARFDKNGNTSSGSFADIKNHWASAEINIAANNGWIVGYEDGTFRPDSRITRAEAMTLVNHVLQRVPEYASDLLEDMIKWPDNMDKEKWYYLAVQEATNSHTYERKLNGYETWQEIEEVRDWAAIER